MSAKNSSNVGGCQAGCEAAVTDTAIATGGDDRREVGGGRGAGAGIDTDIQVVTGPISGADVGIEMVTEVLTCRRASASV
jgi:hypothetical protein